MTALREPVLYGKYQLLELLARGGMAEVFKAKSHGVEGFEKVLVIKRILPELGRNPRFVEMFINEAKIAVTLSHANIVQVFDLGRADDQYFIAMEFVAGFDLATVLRLGRKHGVALPPELAVYVVSELAKGLDYAHRRRDAEMHPLNIVHRDVSPQNVLLSHEGEVKLTDFGIAKARTTVESSTEAGVLKGKYAYMAPEQATGGEASSQSDLFAVGTVLYEALSGTNPFNADSPFDTLQRVRAGAPRPLRDLVPGVPEELAAIVGHAMAVEPSQRHANAGRLYEDLIQFLYASGRRVGAHDLANYLEDLRDKVATPKSEATDDAQILAAFEAPADRPVTPVEVPAKTPSSTPGTILPRTSRPHAERRDVTALAVEREPGDPLSEATLVRIVHRFGGVTADRDPDDRSWVVLFGTREPDGRDSDTAARCALRISQAAGHSARESRRSTTARIGLHSGRVLVGLEGEPIRDEHFESMIRTARAVAAATPPSEVSASDGAARLLRERFELEVRARADTGRQVHALFGERSFAEAYGKFVGRREELKRVGEVLALANRGKLRVLAVSGDAGCGKTRLVLESVRRLRLGGHDVAVHFAMCSPQNRQVPLAGIQEMLRVILGIDEADSDVSAREKIARLRELGLSVEEIGAVGTTLGIGGDTTSSGNYSNARPLREALRRIVTKLAEDRLTVFAWDGVESMDDESQEVLDGLLRGDRDMRAMVVLAFRKGFVHAWSDLRGYFELVLEPLPDEDIARLTGARLGAAEVPIDLMREVTLKSGGNPLYIEEYLKALSDAGAVEMHEGRVVYKREIAEVEVPRSLRGIVASRIARVTASQRHILQVAAIAGSRFTVELLANVTGGDAADVAKDLNSLEERSIVSRNGEEYGFAHELIAEVLRDGLTVPTRRETHAAIAAALESIFPDRRDELAERLANHYREAGERGRAVEYLVRVADCLESEQALEGANHYLLKAIDMSLSGPSPDYEAVLTMYRRIGELAFHSRALELGAERMQKALDLAEGLGRDAEIARFSMLKGRLLGNASRFDEARSWLARALDVARRLGERTLLRDIALATAETWSKSGDYAKAIGFLEEALEVSREERDIGPQVRSLIPLAMAYAAVGSLDQALAALDEARALASGRVDRFTEVELLKVEGIVHMQGRNWVRAIELGERALDLAKEYGFSYEAAINAHNTGESYLRTGDYKRAFTMLRYSYEIARDIGHARLQTLNVRLLGFIDATKFGSDEGRSRLVQSIEHSESSNIVWDQIEGRYLLAIVDHMRGQVEDARRNLREVLRLASENGYKRYIEDCERALAAIDAGMPVPLPA